MVNAFEGYAYDAGMRVGDKIVSVNSKTVSDLTVEQVRNELRGEPGSSVEVAFERPGLPEVNKVTIERQIVKLRDVKLTTFVGKAEVRSEAMPNDTKDTSSFAARFALR